MFKRDSSPISFRYRNREQDRYQDQERNHVLVHEFMSIYYALAGWSGNRERRDERTKRKRGKEKVRSRSKIPISSKPALRNFVPKITQRSGRDS
ncbi:hypothetical protein EVAR_84910_1 [Eumeta japonica]|uniref:Uncharacterized protein n=1 Tax=Eumeta variegata TaxID=151549 RepID=A0A4C1Z7U9_EUMVA|nr:hypothetical protein EVAR_84910_1 [Eumeta japonica]